MKNTLNIIIFQVNLNILRKNWRSGNYLSCFKKPVVKTLHNLQFDFRQTSLFSLSYQLCTNSHHFCFTLNTPAGQGGEDQLVFDRIIIIQAHSMADIVYDEPLKKDGFVFYVDSHLFTRCWEQPIVLIFHNKDDKNRIFIEEHHIMVS